MSEVHRTEEIQLTNEEWLRRYDAFITEMSDFEGSYSETTGAEDTLEMFRKEVDDPFYNSPEDAAEEEMSNWDNDGE